MLLTTPRLLFALAVAGTGVAAGVPAAQAAYPGGDGGKIVYVKASFDGSTETRQLRIANADGTGDTPITQELTHELADPVWSPDGRKIAYAIRPSLETDWDIAVYDVAQDASELLFDDEEDQGSPTWSPDGTQLAFDQDLDIVRRSSTPGPAPITHVTEDDPDTHVLPFNDTEPAWSVDGVIAFTRNATDGNGSLINLVDAAGGETTELLGAGISHSQPDWSPDGDRLVVNQDHQVALVTPGEDETTILGASGNEDSGPVFSPSGQKVLFSSLRFVDGNEWAMNRLYLATPGTEGSTLLSPALVDAVDADWQPFGKAPDKQPDKQPEQPRNETPPPAQQQPLPSIDVPNVAVPRLTAKVESRRCASKRRFRIRLRVPRGEQVRSAAVTVRGRRVKVAKLERFVATVDLRALPKGRFDVVITTTLKSGRTVKETRRYQTCAPKRSGKRA